MMVKEAAGAVRQTRNPRRQTARRRFIPDTAVTTFSTDWGWFAAAAEDGFLVGTSFGHRTGKAAVSALPQFGAARHSADGTDAELLDELEDRVQSFFAGRATRFDDLPHRHPAAGGSFAAAVVDVVRNIAPGEVRSYGEVAAAAGSPGAARAVGSVMAKNPLPLVVPCHRVVGAGGRLGGYSAAGGIATKERLLALERSVAASK